ncbi:MAG: 3'(2'), 5'-bisphosphate nucleotidase, partial [Gammaproteobacteria bacterium]
MSNQFAPMLNDVVSIAIEAGKAILEIYKQPYEVHEKTDGSPVTTADQNAHNLIEARLRELTPHIPILSEESAAIEIETRRQWNTFWLVDPLDGTKEFIRKNDEFTVNIALMDNGIPVLGVVHTPALDMTHYAASGGGAFKSSGAQVALPIQCRKFAADNAVMVASRSHSGAAVEHYRTEL